MNQIMITERLQDLHILPNIIMRSNRERSDKKAYGAHGKIKRTYKVTVGKSWRFEIIYEYWRFGEDNNLENLKNSTAEAFNEFRWLDLAGW